MQEIFPGYESMEEGFFKATFLFLSLAIHHRTHKPKAIIQNLNKLQSSTLILISKCNEDKMFHCK